MEGWKKTEMYGIYLIAVLVLAGGAIAFIGDRLGTKIGKKRLSLFGLRPRHTSIIITIFTGICITLLTFAIMAAVSENVRTALFGMEKLNARMEQTNRDLSRAMEELSVAKDEQISANEELGKSKTEIEGLKQEQEELRRESERLKSGNRALELANADLMAQNAGLLDNNAVLSESNVKLEEDNKSLEERTQALRQGLITIREGDIVYRAGEVIASGIVKASRSLEDVETDMAGIAALAMQNVSGRLGTEIPADDLLVYQPEYDAAVQTVMEGSQDMVVRIVAAANLVKGEPVRTSIQLYPNSIIYHQGEFIVAKAYEVHEGIDAEQLVMSFLKDVNAAATAKGILPDPLRGSVGVIEGEQFYEVVQAIVPMRGVITLSAYARNATDAMGPLRLNLKLEEVREQYE